MAETLEQTRSDVNSFPCAKLNRT